MTRREAFQWGAYLLVVVIMATACSADEGLKAIELVQSAREQRLGEYELAIRILIRSYLLDEKDLTWWQGDVSNDRRKSNVSDILTILSKEIEERRRLHTGRKPIIDYIDDTIYMTTISTRAQPPEQMLGASVFQSVDVGGNWYIDGKTPGEPKQETVREGVRIPLCCVRSTSIVKSIQLDEADLRARGAAAVAKEIVKQNPVVWELLIIWREEDEVSGKTFGPFAQRHRLVASDPGWKSEGAVKVTVDLTGVPRKE